MWVGALFGLIFGSLFYYGYLGTIENRLIDLRFNIRGGLPQVVKLSLVSISDECLQKLGTWPWRRSYHARLLDILNEAGAKLVVFDFMFNEPSLRGVEDDVIFGQALASAGNAVLPIFFSKKEVLSTETMDVVVQQSVNHPTGVLRSPGVGEGFIDVDNAAINRDGVVRNLRLFDEVEGKTYFAIGLVAAQKILGLPIVNDPEGVRLGSVMLPVYTRWEGMSDPIPLSSFLLNFAGPEIFNEEYSFSDVLDRKTLAGAFKDKIVLVGTRALGLHEDRKFSPFGPLHGVEIHANLIQNILSGRILRRFSPRKCAGAIFLCAWLLSFILWKVPGLYGNLIALGFLISYLGGAVAGFNFDLVLEVSPILIMLPIQWTVIRLVQQFITLRDRNRELAKKVRELSIVNEVSQAVNFMGDITKTLDTILSRAVQALGAERGSILLLDERYESLVEESVVFGVVGKAEFNPDLKSKFKIGEGIAGEVFHRGTSRLITDIARERDFEALSSANVGLKSLICVPLSVRESPIGVMNVVNKTAGLFDQEDLQLALTMANQAAVVIEKARLFNLATIDGLTGLIVHRHFQSKLEEEFRRSKRYDKPLSLLMTDIDHFKKFNDTWGHQTGDLVLREVAKCVRASIRETDVAARYGGEEFVIILPETEIEGARQFAERLRQKVETQPLTGPKGELHVTISLGVSSVPQTGAESTLEMIKFADEALYDAKHSGRNRVGVYGEKAGQEAPKPAAPTSP